MTEPAEPLDINTLNNVHVIEELIQLPVGSDTVVISNSYWTKILRSTFLSNTAKAAASVLDSVHALEAIKKHWQDECLVEC